jgi:uncharacterized membrane protein
MYKMQKILNIIFGISVIWLISTCTAEYAITVLFVIAPFHIIMNRGYHD